MKTLIISDNPFELAVLAQALIHLDVTVAGQASNPIDALNIFKTVNPDSVIIDIRFNENNAIKLCKEFREIDPLIGLVVITDSPDLRILGLTLSILPSGAQLVLKSSNNVIGLLCQAIELSIDAASTKSASMWIQGDNLYSHKLFASVLSGLTDIQIETLRHVGNGLSNSEISKVRFVTEKSVEQIVTKISQHFGVGSDPTKNQRVLLAGEYFKWIGAIRH
ncbi:unannotated protein [freshwater metagenome]|uniref:Unannotated protein n=1 Tax=freshwater metagenome TaxID=449393 RepID=A0A6J7I3B3_9ZZZZ|nr:response regulator [Actinomycetota bacterium]